MVAFGFHDQIFQPDEVCQCSSLFLLLVLLLPLPCVSGFLINSRKLCWSRLPSHLFFVQVIDCFLDCNFPLQKPEYDFRLSRTLTRFVSLSISNCCCLSCSSNDALFLLGSVGKSELRSTSDALWTGVFDALKGVLTEVASSVDQMEFLLVKAAIGVNLNFLFFLFCFVF